MANRFGASVGVLDQIANPSTQLPKLLSFLGWPRTSNPRRPFQNKLCLLDFVPRTSLRPRPLHGLGTPGITSGRMLDGQPLVGCESLYRPSPVKSAHA